ncbi:uncharacterized protein SCHCODRAFT_02714917 [Schizophyllum commune H4-8]|nr:uncharacterized protein SCHCODRAFT_02714917 [Schizophyllum commune H4-8]KAI5886941.1 hypothetical protein SCHCODRAFT_02714917 [Schizophyllum commune H4-8]
MRNEQTSDALATSRVETPFTPTSQILSKHMREEADDGDLHQFTPRTPAFTCLYDDATHLRAWVGGIVPCYTSLQLTLPSLAEGSTSPSLADEADAALAQYAQETFRVPLHVVRTGRRLPEVSFLIYQKRDTSRFSRSQWAE